MLSDSIYFCFGHLIIGIHKIIKVIKFNYRVKCLLHERNKLFNIFPSYFSGTYNVG